MKLTDRITIDPEICHGNPVIRGLTRLSQIKRIEPVLV
ncbi:MAG: DUF433 domain-containing protein [Blastocatellia bacterium]